MEKAAFENSILKGSVSMPASKSVAHRALICSFLASRGTVSPLGDSKDIRATQSALKALKKEESIINCAESGSTLRFIVPLAAALGRNVCFTGTGRLPLRPIDEFLNFLPKHGVKCKTEGGLPMEISGKLESGIFEVNGNVSSQYITGLLLSLPYIKGNSEIHLTTPLQSKPYVDITLKVLKDYGITVEETKNGYIIPGNQKYNNIDYYVEGDWSQAAFFMSAAAVGGEVTLKNLNYNSAQGDKSVVDVMRKFGAEVILKDNCVLCKKGSLRGIEIDCRNIPDMVPAIAVTAAFAKGKTVISGAERLRHKESDRISAVASNLRLMGVSAEETEGGMIITPGNEVLGAEINGYNDHRIVMAFAVAALFAKGKTVITDANSINKSYPEFFDDYNKLGGKANVFSVRQ
ncbi:MAG: 3-phosphoshikimate 1-carboxyvinyltransferase [Clostridiales bacterium]|nr:3-phosphoshikimate 1-carboxyvinyltransferase [Clostridiales bacterium]